MENNQHKDFNKFFQKKLNNRQFDYQDDFWTEMESQLPQSITATKAPKGESRKRFLFMLLFLVGFLSLIGWFTYPSNNTFVTKGNIISESESKIEISNTDLGSEFNTNTKIDSKDNKNSKEHSNTIINTINGNSIVENNVVNNRSTNSGNIISNQKENTPNTIDNNEIKTNAFDSNELDFIYNTKGSSDFGIKEIKNKVSGEQPIATIQKQSKPNDNGNSIKPSTIQSTNLLNNNDESSITSLLTKQFNLTEQQIDKSHLIQPLCDGCPVLPPAHEFRIGLIAGLNTSLGFQNVSNTKSNPSFDPSVGLRITYRHSMTSSWRTSVEAIYFSRSALNTQINYDSISYGFGSTIVCRSINIEELHYISLPIYATYQYKKKHTFMGGLSFSYLLNAQSQTTGNIVQMTADDANIYAEPQTQEWGYTTAFNRFDFGTTLGYDYEVQEGWKVGARLNYGLRDVTKNNIFNNNVFDNNISFRLIMTCDLFTL